MSAGGRLNSRPASMRSRSAAGAKRESQVTEPGMRSRSAAGAKRESQVTEPGMRSRSAAGAKRESQVTKIRVCDHNCWCGVPRELKYRRA
jgi:hypothetical protein